MCLLHCQCLINSKIDVYYVILIITSSGLEKVGELYTVWRVVVLMA